jgi:hypothetical protein
MRTGQVLFPLGIEPGIPRARPCKELLATGAQATWLTLLTRYEQSDKADCFDGISITNNIFFPTKLSNSTGCGPELIAYKSNEFQIITSITKSHIMYQNTYTN